MSDDDGIPKFVYCYDDRGVCDRFPHLQNDRFFTVKLEETFDVCTVRKDKHFIVINIITCASFVQRVIYGFFSIRLVPPVPCQTICIGEAWFWFR